MMRGQRRAGWAGSGRFPDRRTPGATLPAAIEMADTSDKGAFQADIPSSAVEDALGSVERISDGAGATGTRPEVAVEETGGNDPRNTEIEKLRAQLELSQAAGRELMEKLEAEHDRLLRAAADLENYRKRAQREKDEIQKFGVEKLVKDLLPVADNLDRALAAAPAGDPLVDGVKLVRASLEQALGKCGVRSFSAMGQLFDPSQHEALLQVQTAEEPPGTVVIEHARGFTLHDRLVRPAMVGVASAPPAEQPGAGAAPGEAAGGGDESA